MCIYKYIYILRLEPFCRIRPPSRIYGATRPGPAGLFITIIIHFYFFVPFLSTNIYIYIYNDI